MRIWLLAVLALLAGCSQPKPNLPRVYVSDERGNAVLLVEPATGDVVERIAAGVRPRGLQLAPDGRTLFVAVSGSPIGGPGVDEDSLPPPDRRKDGIAAIDTRTNRVTRVLSAGADPETFALTPDGRTLLVSNEDSGTVSAVDPRGLVPTRRVKVGAEPEGIAVTRDARTLFVACEGADAVYRIDLATLEVKGTTPLAGRPRTLLASADGRSIYVAVEAGGQLAVLDATTGAVARQIDLARGDKATRPMGLAENADGTLFVTTGRGSGMLVVDPRAGRVVRRIDDVGVRPWGIARLRNGAVVTANGFDGTIATVDPRRGAVVQRDKVGVSPWGVVAAP